MNKIAFVLILNQNHAKKNFFATLFLCLFTVIINAQINYVDIDPDISGGANFSQNFDLDSDGTDDYTISSGDFGLGNSFGITPLNGNAVITTGFATPAVLSVDLVINDAANWDTYESSQNFYLDLFNFGFIITGDWQGITDGYVGLRFNSGDNVYYGWLRMDVTDNATWTLKDYAYITIPNAQIAAGQAMVLETEREFSSDVRVFTNNNQEIEIINLPEESNYNLYSITGQQIKQGVAQKNSHSIATYNLSTGVYILKIEGVDSGKILTKKFIL